MLNLERLRVLRAVATTGSIVGAADTLHVTTSAVSQQIGRLEREVGQSLVERQGRGIRLTEAGRRLADHADKLLTHAEHVEATMAAHRGTVAGHLTIATFATAARGLLPVVLHDLRAHPDLTVSLSEQEPHEAIPALTRGRLDIAIVQDWHDNRLRLPDTLSRQQLTHDTFDVAMAAHHPLAARDTVTVDDLRDEAWITWPPDQICHDWLTATLGPTHLRIAHTASEHSTQLALVATDLGIALIPRLGRDPAPPTVRFVPLTPSPTRDIYALWRTAAASHPAITATVDALVRHCRSELSRPTGD
ncbi:LysR family transcriptional regulator [Nocardia sp. NPDC049149]|uniref:LysR family transcriptional regulator n=1 Tax=Nocardia sp. NPDC049149 TaxID=3364315 RepID=UPI0037226A0F